MRNEGMAVLRHVAHYGQIASGDTGYSGPIPDDFTFNSPIGLCMDRNHHVWICDTGNNRVLVVDRDLTRIVRIIRAPGEGVKPFLMPFHVCQHPRLDRMYITDIGNSRVVVMDFEGGRFDFAFDFGYAGDGINGEEFEPLQDPNGITLVGEPDGTHALYVCDEFFHAHAQPGQSDSKSRSLQPNRCVKFSDEGRYLGEFNTVAPDPAQPRKDAHTLYWPQGISSDADANLYIANTGAYEILKTPGVRAAPAPRRRGRNASGQVVAGQVFEHGFGKPNGIGMLNIMRSVNVIGERVFVADHVMNTISVYACDGTPLTTIAGINPLWNHGHEHSRSLGDLAYYGMEDEALLSPYVICQGEADDIFLVSEPFTSRILKLRIPDFTQPLTEAELLVAIGNRRDTPERRRDSPQFNCVTSVVGLRDATRAPARAVPDNLPDMPAWLKYNPWQQWYMGVSAGVTEQYRIWYDQMHQVVAAGLDVAHPAVFNVDAGNWTIRAWSASQQAFGNAPRVLEGYYLPGDLAMAMYYPQRPLLGQLCPGTPLMFVTNFNFGTVSIYQFGPQGKLLNYGVPFGIKGKGAGCLSGPQGLVVSDQGEIHIADSLNNRIAKWQILQTGQVVFIRNFTWDAACDGTEGQAFMPTDVAIDDRQRLLVTDQFSNRICAFDRDGASLWSYGKEGYWDNEDSDPTHFMLPTSLCIDGEFLVVNDLVNRALKIFRVGADGLEFVSGRQFFKNPPEQGGIWMPYLLYAHQRRIYVPDSTYNVVQIFEY